MWILLKLFVVLFMGYWGLGVILYLMQPTFLYKPARDIYYTPEELGLDFEDVYFKTPDELTLNGWFVTVDHTPVTILLCHGNGGNIMHRLDTINLFAKLGMNCFVFDYRGYGNSQGTPTEEGTYLDALAAYDWLTQNKKVPPEKIVIMGRSLGGCIAAYLAARVPAKGLVLESTFTSYADIGAKFYPYMPVRWFARFNYNTIGHLRQVHCPVLIIHSRNDEVVPFEFGLELYEAANEPCEFVEIFGSHNDGFLVSAETYKNAWTNWLKSLNRQASGRQAPPAS